MHASLYNNHYVLIQCHAVNLSLGEIIGTSLLAAAIMIIATVIINHPIYTVAEIGLQVFVIILRTILRIGT